MIRVGWISIILKINKNGGGGSYRVLCKAASSTGGGGGGVFIHVYIIYTWRWDANFN